MTTPLVSVCCITYNHGPFIAEALESAVNQDLDGLEVVVADDGSSDGTYETALDVAARHSGRVRVLPPRTNTGIQGIVLNYNRALRACRGRYIAFLEGDDCYLPGKLSAQLAWFEADERRVLCGHDIEAFDSESGRVLYRWSERFGLPSGSGPDWLIRNKVPFSTVAVMVRGEAVPPRGFDNRLRVVLDWKFWIDCLMDGGHFGFVDGVLARYRRHSGNISAVASTLGRADQFATLDLIEAEHRELADLCRLGRAGLHYTRGVDLLLNGTGDDMPEARRQLMKAVAAAPLALRKAWAALLLGLMPARAVQRVTTWLGVPRREPADQWTAFRG